MVPNQKVLEKTCEQLRLERPSVSQIDTLRVMAMLGVFLHHLWKGIMVTLGGPVESGLDAVFGAASDGVVFFNIISGFLLALPYLGPASRPFPGYGNFLGKRLLRIIPSYYLALVAFSLGNMLVFGVPLYSALSTLLIHLSFINSLDYQMMLTNFSAFWYLGMLAQFYLLFPFVLRLFLRIGAARAALLILGSCWGAWFLLASISGAVPVAGAAESLFHFNLPGRLPEFAVGMWLASVWNESAFASSRRFSLNFDRPFFLLLIAMALYVVSAAPFIDKMELPLLHIFHVSACVVLLMALFVWTPFAAAGRSRLIRELSAVSYAIYIVHQPIFSYLGIIPGRVPSTLGEFAGRLAILFPIAYLAAKALNLTAEWMVRKIRCWGKCSPVPGVSGTEAR